MVKEDTIIKQVVAYLKENFDIADVFIFGSILGENFSLDSDIDIALYLKDYDKYSLKDFAKKLIYIQNHISSRLELHFFPAKTEPLTFSDYIRNTGRKVA